MGPMTEIYSKHYCWMARPDRSTNFSGRQLQHFVLYNLDYALE